MTTHILPIRQAHFAQLCKDFDRHKGVFAKVFCEADACKPPSWGDKSERPELTRFTGYYLDQQRALAKTFRTAEMDSGYNLFHNSGLTIKIRTMREAIFPVVEVPTMNVHPTADDDDKVNIQYDVLLLVQRQCLKTELYFGMACILTDKLPLLKSQGGQGKQKIYIPKPHDQMHAQWDWHYEADEFVEVRTPNKQQQDELWADFRKQAYDGLIANYQQSTKDRRTLLNSIGRRSG